VPPGFALMASTEPVRSHAVATTASVRYALLSIPRSTHTAGQAILTPRARNSGCRGRLDIPNYLRMRPRDPRSRSSARRYPGLSAGSIRVGHPLLIHPPSASS